MQKKNKLGGWRIKIKTENLVSQTRAPRIWKVDTKVSEIDELGGRVTTSNEKRNEKKNNPEKFSLSDSLARPPE